MIPEDKNATAESGVSGVESAAPSGSTGAGLLAIICVGGMLALGIVFGLWSYARSNRLQSGIQILR